ncbi:MAG: DMT family transporter [Myxococcaceae bacterium]
MSTFATLLLAFLGLAGGACLVVQASLNAGLRTHLGSVGWAGLISYVGGTLAMAVSLLVARVPLPIANARTAPGVWWLGGFFGAAYLGASIVLVPRVGAATAIALVVAGQLVCSLVLDQYGFLGVPQHSFSFTRALGALLLFGGVLLIRR